MTSIEVAYLALVVIAFAVFSGTMFWGMMISNSAAPVHDRKAEDPHSLHR